MLRAMHFPRRLVFSCTLLIAPAAAFAQSTDGYDANCRSCHGQPPSGGAERGRSLEAIRAAIDFVPNMRFLSGLSDAVLTGIAARIRGRPFFIPSPEYAPDRNYTDLWFNPQEPGWGASIVQHGSTGLFAVVYTYDAAGKPTWFVMPGGYWNASNDFRGTLYRATGPTQAPSFDGIKVNSRAVGNASLIFTDSENGTFSYSVDGQSVAKSIRRQPF